jgi:hypothetical protein
MDYQTYQDVDNDIKATVTGFPASADRMPRDGPRRGTRRRQGQRPECPNSSPASKERFCSASRADIVIGVDISSKVGGPPGGVGRDSLNPEDIAPRLADGNGHGIACRRITVTGPAKSNRECQKGVVYYTRPVVLGGLSHRHGLRPLYGLEQNPVRASIRKA